MAGPPSYTYRGNESYVSDEEAPVEDKPIHLTMNRAHKVVAPPFVTPSEEFISVAVLLEKLSESRAALEAFVAQADEEKMRKRHLEQVEEIKQELGY